MNFQLFHQISFWMMYACLGAAIFVAVERVIVYLHTVREAEALEAWMAEQSTPLADALGTLSGKGIPSVTLEPIARARANGAARETLENASQAAYLDGKSRLNRHLWILDTVVTAAPLLGLLGTILGIIETFSALASNGVSDPKGVSAGIGTALFATALGISVALIVVVMLNHFHDKVDRLGDRLKILILHAVDHA